ncbi:MAG: cytochrome c-type biogenesis protein CcmH [Dehalococcoidia bacterium]
MFLIPTRALADNPDADKIEVEAQKIDQMLMCPVCPAESIDQVQVEVAKQMRIKVRDMLTEGQTEGQILDYFEQRYGSDILAAPPIRGTMVLAWIIPVIILVLMMSAGLWVLYNMVYGKRDIEG